MELREMYKFTKECVDDFEKALRIKNEHKLRNVILASIEECGSEFEEQTLIENFREVYKKYLEMGAIPA